MEPSKHENQVNKTFRNFILSSAAVSVIMSLILEDNRGLNIFQILADSAGKFIAIMILPTLYGIALKVIKGHFPKKAFVRIGTTVLVLVVISAVLSFYRK